MAIEKKLFSGQCSSMGEQEIELSLSATSKVMPLHPGDKRPRVHSAPKKTSKKLIIKK